MSDDLEVAKGEWGVTRVFALDLAPDAARRAGTGEINGAGGLAGMLGVDALDHSRVEVFMPEDLGGLGLGNYLVEGYGVAPGDADAQRPALEGHGGPVAVIASAAFAGQAATLDPRPPIRLLATFREAAAVPPMDPIRSDAAKGTTRASRPRARERRAAPARGWLVAGAVAAAAAIVLLVAAR